MGECLMEVRNKPLPVKREAETEVGMASRELERYQAMTEREKAEFNMVERTSASPKEHSSSPAPKKARLMGLGGASLLEIWKSRLEREAAKKHVEFAGRRNLGEVAKLYIKLEKETTVKLEETVK